MPLITKYRHGVPCWIDASVHDVPAATEFYTKLFGWTARDNGAEYGNYVSLLKDGRDVAGLMAVQNPNQPAAWTTYIASDDIQKTETLIGEAGGTIIVEPMELMGLGRMMFAQDPSGAYFGVWEAGAHAGSEIVNELNAPIWHECQSRDIAAAKDFYSKVFGWTFVANEDSSGYTTIMVGSRAVGGMMAMVGPQWGQIPSNWMAYIQVQDVDAMALKAVELGGQVLLPAMDIAAGRFCVIGDSEHAVIAMITSSMVDDPNTGWND